MQGDADGEEEVGGLRKEPDQCQEDGGGVLRELC